MSELSKAVFLSYASQDAEAAKRVCDTLRGAGVEVWFDADGGLEHGDEWDVKIRRQIKECVLFIPVISANTEAREEGYFRIEWDLAAERARGIASGVAFILPVVVDGTREQEALVPDRFRAVQWTRLPGGVISPEIKARFLKLWSHRTGALKHEAAPKPESRPAEEPAPQRRGFPKVALVAGGLLAALAVGAYVLMKSGAPAAPTTGTTPDSAAPAPAKNPVGPNAESARLVAQAWEQMNKPELARAELEVADGFCKRATELDPNGADAWAAWSQVDSWYIYHGFDDTPARREGARTKAARALKLAPASFEARLAEACYIVRGPGGSGVGNQGTAMDVGDADAILSALLREKPAEPRALLARAILQRNLGNMDAARATLEQLSRNPSFAALAWNEIGWAELFGAREANFEKALAAADRSIALQPYWGNLGLRMLIAEGWLGDLDLAKAALEQIPAAVRQEDYGIAQACGLYFLRREPANLLRVLEGVPRNWLHANNFDGPTAWWAGRAHELAGHHESAQLQWQAALKLVEQRLADQPNAEALLELKADLLARMGRAPEADSTWRLAREIRGDDALKLTLEATFDTIQGRVDAAIPLLERGADEFGPRVLTAADLRLNPDYDPLRGNPRFQALLARLGADPRFNPGAKTAGAADSHPGPPAAAPSSFGNPAEDGSGKSSPTDPKSVAVLAFANLSDDRANEYFSDGISEELLNVLAKISELKVAARTSAFYFKGKEVPVPEIARQLGVAYVVEGSVRKSGDRVRITAQLIKAADGFHVWSDTFTRDLKDVFSVQDEIAGLIAKNLRAKMSLGRERTAVDPEVYSLLLQARHAAGLQTIEGAHVAVKLYRDALGKAADNAEAWAELAHAYQYLARFGGMDTGEGMRECRVAARKALDLDSEQPIALAAVGWVQRTDEHDWRGAIQSFQHALTVAPENVTIMSDAAICFLNVGRHEEAIQLATRATERDPLNPSAFWTLGIVQAFTGQFARAEAPYRRAIELAPAADEYHSHLARVLTMLNRLDEAKAEAQLEPSERYRLTALAGIYFRAGDTAGGKKALDELATKYADSMEGYIAIIYAQAGMRDEAFTWLERAYERRDSAVAWIKNNGFTLNLHADPRWPAFLRKMGLADDQLQ